ncbi:MAG: hypothetical protein ACLTM6_10140 [Eggerthella lenta]
MAAWTLKAALDNARKGAGAQGREAAGMEACGREAGGTAEWAKLDMHEFTSIEDWPTLQDIIDGKLDDCGIAHDWHKEAQGKTYLLFRAEDAPSLVRAFDEMSRAVDAAKEKAWQAACGGVREGQGARTGPGQGPAHGDHARTGANERLADKAEMAKAAAEELRKNAHEVPDRERTFNRERAQGR